MEKKQHVTFPGNILMIGFGSIGQATLAPLFETIDVSKDRVTILTADPRGKEVAEKMGVKFDVEALNRDNYRTLLPKYVKKGDLIINLSVDTSSVDIMSLCNELGVLYVDTVVEPWTGEGGYADTSIPFHMKSNAALRFGLLELRNKLNGGVTAVSCCGANPGVVSFFAQKAMVDIAHAIDPTRARPRSKEEWVALAHSLGIKTIHIAEQDTQVAASPKEKGVFVNTWSVDGFYSEGGLQRAEATPGVHEKELPEGWQEFKFGNQPVWLGAKTGMQVKVKSWTPLGAHVGYLVTHNEASSIPSWFSGTVAGTPYRPTCHYAYLPCPGAVESIDEFLETGTLQPRQHILGDDIVKGMDALGVLLLGDKLPNGATGYWYGSMLTIEEARQIAPYNQATSLQVVAGVLAGAVYAIKHPNLGIIEADELDYEEALEVALPYLGTMKGEYTTWTPVPGDTSCQLKNFITS